MFRFISDDLDHPERRHPSAFDVWRSVRKQLGPGQKITALTSGPLTNLASIISMSDMDAGSVIEVCSSLFIKFAPLVVGCKLSWYSLYKILLYIYSLYVQRVYVVGGVVRDGGDDRGNVFTVPSNRYAEFNMFLDPLAAKTVLESGLNITLIPLNVQRKVASFEGVLGALKQHTQHTPESKLVRRLLLLLQQLQREQRKFYHHMVNNEPLWYRSISNSNFFHWPDTPPVLIIYVFFYKPNQT